MIKKDKSDGVHSFHLEHVHLKPQQQIVSHQQPTWELSYIISGEGERIIGNTREPFHSGDVTLIVPQMPHCWIFNPEKTDKDGMIENITITFSDELLETTARSYPETVQMIERLRKLPESILFVKHTAHRLVNLLNEMSSQTAPVQLFLLLQIIMLMASSDEHKVIGHFNLSSIEQRVRNIETFITCNYKRSITLADLSRHIGMNQTSLCKFLKRHHGKTFTECLNECRMAEACNLLAQTDLTISEVCYRSGFNDVPYFCRIFKQKKGMTPTEYRKTTAIFPNATL